MQLRIVDDGLRMTSPPAFRSPQDEEWRRPEVGLPLGSPPANVWVLNFEQISINQLAGYHGVRFSCVSGKLLCLGSEAVDYSACSVQPRVQHLQRSWDHSAYCSAFEKTSLHILLTTVADQHYAPRVYERCSMDLLYVLDHAEVVSSSQVCDPSWYNNFQIW